MKKIYIIIIIFIIIISFFIYHRYHSDYMIYIDDFLNDDDINDL